MANNYTRGDFAFFTFQPSGGAVTTLCITGSTLDIEVLTYDIINTCSGGYAWRLTGRTDARGTVTADLDLDALPFAAAPSIIPGTRGVAVFGLSPGKGIQIPCLVKKLHFEVAMQAQVKYSFDVELDARAGQLVYPA